MDLIVLKAAGTVTKGFLQAASIYIFKGFRKPPGLKILRRFLIYIKISFGNSFVIALAALTKIGRIVSVFKEAISR
jgi:hypothetical protein